MSRFSPWHAACFAAFSLLLSPLAAQAQDPLRIAFADPVSSLDPQLNNNAGDRSMDLFFFDLLVNKDNHGISPGLATAWRLVSPLVWEFDLRQGVKWQDGQPFTSDDILFSYLRALNVPGSVASFAGFLRSVAKVEAIGPYGLRITTREPNPLLLLNLSSVHIVSRHVGEHATSEDYNTGRAVIGTGPFRLVSYEPGARAIMRRNDDYWGTPSIWANVDYRYIGSPAVRTASLLAGDVDVIDKVSVADITKLKANPNVTVFPYRGLRVLVLQPGFTPGPNRYVTGADGHALAKNPILDPQVRRALNIAINRTALADRLMQGAANPASQMMPEGTVGYDPSITMPPFDPDGAKKLLADAGYPDGFNLVMHIPADRYLNGSETAQAVAGMWSRIGVRTTLEPLAWSMYQSRVNKGEFAMTMIAWGNGTGEASYGILNILATQDLAHGQGVSNWGHYSNPDVDHALDQAMATFEDNEREAILRHAMQIVDHDVALLPLFHYQDIWAARKGLVVKPLVSDRTVAVMVSRE